MSPRFAYIYFMSDDPDRVRAAVPKHVSHWHGLELSGYVGGPFEDHTGGLITFDADEDRARDAVERDPFLLERLLADHCLKRWAPE
jgi:uncharacterized protein YciI